MVDVVNAAEIASMEADVQAWYDHLCNIHRDTSTADVYGGESQTTSVVASGVPCNIQASVQTLRTTEIIGEQIASRQVYQISFPPGTDVEFHDRVVITTATPQRELVVAAVLQPESLELERVAIGTMEGEPIV